MAWSWEFWRFVNTLFALPHGAWWKPASFLDFSFVSGRISPPFIFDYSSLNLGLSSRCCLLLLKACSLPSSVQDTRVQAAGVWMAMSDQGGGRFSGRLYLNFQLPPASFYLLKVSLNFLLIQFYRYIYLEFLGIFLCSWYMIHFQCHNQISRQII